MRNERGQFTKGSSGNPHGRPTAAKSARALRAAIRDGADDIVAAMMDAALAGDVQAARLLLDRSLPALKPESEKIELPEMDTDNVADRAKAVLSAVAAGEVSPDSGATVINSIAGLARISEIADLEQRIAQLEAQRNA